MFTLLLSLFVAAADVQLAQAQDSAQLPSARSRSTSAASATYGMPVSSGAVSSGVGGGSSGTGPPIGTGYLTVPRRALRNGRMLPRGVNVGRRVPPPVWDPRLMQQAVPVQGPRVSAKPTPRQTMPTPFPQKDAEYFYDYEYSDTTLLPTPVPTFAPSSRPSPAPSRASSAAPTDNPEPRAPTSQANVLTQLPCPYSACSPTGSAVPAPPIQPAVVASSAFRAMLDNGPARALRVVSVAPSRVCQSVRRTVTVRGKGFAVTNTSNFTCAFFPVCEDDASWADAQGRRCASYAGSPCPASVAAICPGTCRTCPVLACQDHDAFYKQCASVKQIGQCEANVMEMMVRCASTCAMCGRTKATVLNDTALVCQTPMFGTSLQLAVEVAADAVHFTADSIRIRTYDCGGNETSDPSNPFAFIVRPASTSFVVAQGSVRMDFFVENIGQADLPLITLQLQSGTSVQSVMCAQSLAIGEKATCSILRSLTESERADGNFSAVVRAESTFTNASAFAFIAELSAEAAASSGPSVVSPACSGCVAWWVWLVLVLVLLLVGAAVAGLCLWRRKTQSKDSSSRRYNPDPPITRARSPDAKSPRARTPISPRSPRSPKAVERTADSTSSGWRPVESTNDSVMLIGPSQPSTITSKHPAGSLHGSSSEGVVPPDVRETGELSRLVYNADEHSKSLSRSPRNSFSQGEGPPGDRRITLSRVSHVKYNSA